MVNCPYGPDASCNECDDTSQVCHPEHGKDMQDLETRVGKLESDIKELSDRLFALEEKDRQCAREEHNKELALDELKEGQDSDQFMFEGC